MKLVHQNPYRIAGILAGATERDIQRQKGKISKFASIGKEVTSEFDFSFLDPISRSAENVERAFSNIEQNQDKLLFSLLWFVNGNSFDETALEYLKKGDEEKALGIWTKVTEGKEINSKNYTSFLNLATLNLTELKTQYTLKKWIGIKIQVILSDCFSDFVKLVADETFNTDPLLFAKSFVDFILPDFEKKYSFGARAGLFEDSPSEIQKYVKTKLSEEPIHKIESLVNSTKDKRLSSPEDAYQFGHKLYLSSKDDMSSLKTTLGSSNLNYSRVAESLAKELLQCGIDYFQEVKEYKDPSKEGLQLLKFAQSIAVKPQTKQRISENIEGMTEWANTAPIKVDIDYITNQLKQFHQKSDDLFAAKALVTSCKPKLNNIKAALGAGDPFYLDISSAVANNSLNMVIAVVNQAQSGLEFDRSKILKLPDIVSNAVSVINSISLMDMDTQTRNRFDENRKTIKGIDQQLENVRRQTSYSSTTRSTSSTSTSTSSSNGDEINWIKVIGIIIGIILLIRACAG